MVQLPLKLTESPPDDSLRRDYELRWDVIDGTGRWIFSTKEKEDAEFIIKRVNDYAILEKAVYDFSDLVAELNRKLKEAGR